MTTIETLSTAQVESLLREANDAGDEETADECQTWLSAPVHSSRFAAAADKIVSAINYAEAQA